VRILRWRGWEERGMSDLRRDQLFAEEECRVFTEMVLGGDSIAIQDTTATQWWEPDSRGMNWVRSLAAAPLFDEGRVRGALILFSSRRDYFTPMHMELLEGFASQAATATRNARLFGMVSRSRAELRRLSAQVISAQEEQRRRISRELHDEVGQALTGIVIHATVLESSLADRKDTTMFVDRARDVAALARHTLEQIRGLSHLLRPTILDDLGVGPAVRWFAERFSSRSGLAVEVDVGSLGDTRFEQAVETTLYRAVQEALTNVARHAHATRARVKIDGAPDGVLLRVEDDGCGFESDGALSSQTHDSGLGLLGMRERVIGLGGQLEIGSQPGVGTTIVVRLPVVPEMR